MRTILLVTAAAASMGIAGVSGISAAPINGAAIDSAANAGLLTEQVDCRRYPHRHRGANPHGWGRGCPPKAATKKKTT
jgi:hypothetical protein